MHNTTGSKTNYLTENYPTSIIKKMGD